MSTVDFNEDDVKNHLDTCIKYWRAKRDEAREISSKDPARMFPAMQSTSQLKAECYIDAFQSIRTALFGNPLE